MFTLNTYRKDPANPAVFISETIPLPKAKIPEDIDVQRLPGGSAIVLAPSTCIGLGPEIAYFTITSDGSDPGDDEPAKGIHSLKFDRAELILILRALDLLNPDDPEEENLIARIRRAIARKRGEE